MKVVNQLAVLISLGALLPFAVSAKSPEQTYLDASLKAPGVPVPARRRGQTIRVPLPETL